MFIRLSYNLIEDFPPLSPNPNRLVDRISEGSRSNRFSIQITSHLGTHIDSPYHFNINGKRIVDFSVENYVFEKPLIINVNKNDEEFISRSDLVPYAEKIIRCDLLMLRTGFSKYRLTDSMRYARRNPGISRDAARYLVENFSNIRALAIDAISIEFEGNFAHEFQAHKILLGDNAHPILLIEDVNLDFDFSHLLRVIALPLFIEKVDGSPCTVIAEVKEK